MKESYGEGIASHPGPESCVGIGNGAREALTGGSTGQPLSPEILDIEGADAVPLRWKATATGPSNARTGRTLRGRRTWHAWTLLARKAGEPAVGHGRRCRGPLTKPCENGEGLR